MAETGICSRGTQPQAVPVCLFSFLLCWRWNPCWANTQPPPILVLKMSHLYQSCLLHYRYSCVPSMDIYPGHTAIPATQPEATTITHPFLPKSLCTESVNPFDRKLRPENFNASLCPEGYLYLSSQPSPTSSALAQN